MADENDWQELLEPHIARFEAAAITGGSATYNTVGSAAMAKMLTKIGQFLDIAVSIENEEKEASHLLKLADRFYFGKVGNDDIWVVCRDRERDHWAIWNGSSVYNTFGEWEWEPQPSSRDDAFYERCRWSRERAILKAKMLVEGV